MIRNCDICNNDFNLHEHASGIVINDSVFACCTCIQNKPKEEIKSWVVEKLGGSSNFRPIGRWVIEQERK